MQEYVLGGCGVHLILLLLLLFEDFNFSINKKFKVYEQDSGIRAAWRNG